MAHSLESERLNDLLEIILANEPEILAIYLFGSRSKGTQSADSDIDLAVLKKFDQAEINTWELSQRLASKVTCNIDLIDLSQASTVMRMQVISQGQRLYCADENACEIFEDFVFSDYSRLNEERATILEDVSERGSVYG